MIKSLTGYLQRREVLKIGRLSIRVHDIHRNDATPFLHSHPFSYVSFIIRGGYTENLEGEIIIRPTWSWAFRKCEQHHRIVDVLQGTKTIFLSWDHRHKWSLRDTGETVDGWIDYPKGLYRRTLWGKDYFCRFDGYWRVGHQCKDRALREDRPSIDQSTSPINTPYESTSI